MSLPAAWSVTGRRVQSKASSITLTSSARSAGRGGRLLSSVVTLQRPASDEPVPFALARKKEMCKGQIAEITEDETCVALFSNSCHNAKTHFAELPLA
eukprot:3842303-Amphidinium_carterae.1